MARGFGTVEWLLIETQTKSIKMNKSVQRGILKKEKAKLDAILRMSLMSVILFYNTWRSQRNAIYLAKINRRLKSSIK